MTATRVTLKEAAEYLEQKAAKISDQLYRFPDSSGFLEERRNLLRLSASILREEYEFLRMTNPNAVSDMAEAVSEKT